MSYWKNEYTKHVILYRGKSSRRGVVQEQETIGFDQAFFLTDSEYVMCKILKVLIPSLHKDFTLLSGIKENSSPYILLIAPSCFLKIHKRKGPRKMY